MSASFERNTGLFLPEFPYISSFSFLFRKLKLEQTPLKSPRETSIEDILWPSERLLGNIRTAGKTSPSNKSQPGCLNVNPTKNRSNNRAGIDIGDRPKALLVSTYRRN
ncbi:MAG: hypothetical protein ACTSYA_01525 [Candidatus Kariarchaeaceae archaeon]